MNNYTKKTLNEYISFTESTLKKFSYKNKLGLQSSVADAMDYSLEAGGKRIRPVLVLAFCHMCGGDYRKAAAPAAAIEMIHTFSLIHDDLPCMDNDDFRRGKPSCHKKFGEACAVLAGDALAIRPFQVIAESELNDSMKIKLIAELACSSGAEGMIGGQIIDMENEQRSTVNGENLRMMYALKTGRLIKTSCVMGCIAAEASDEQVKNAEEYAHCLGLAFQIIDDILDAQSTAEELGKSVGSDARDGKTTFLSFMSADEARSYARRVTDAAIDAVAGYKGSETLVALAEWLLTRRK